MISTVQSRLSADNTATDPAKAAPEPPMQQTVAAYSAGNTEEQAILMYNDAGMPLGSPGFDGRSAGNFSTPGTFEGDITTMTNALLPYSSFRGWSWAANWWNFDNATDETFTQTQINTYNSDLATAQSTGVWNASGTGILDTYGELALELSRRCLEHLRLHAGDRGEPAVGADRPARPSAMWTVIRPSPSVSCRNRMDRRSGNSICCPGIPRGISTTIRCPGKKANVHPEIWNDTGTGEQILQNTFMALLRQPDGVGCSTGCRRQQSSSKAGKSPKIRAAPPTAPPVSIAP